MNRYEFIKKGTKNVKYIWQSPLMMVVFSDASYQACDEYSYVKDIEDILYLYYDVDIYYKKRVFSKDEDSIEDEPKYIWKKVSSVSAYDFPTILQLQHVLKLLLNNEIPLEEYRKFDYYTRENEPEFKGYEYTFESEGFLCDDHYLVKHTIQEREGEIINNFYTFYAGASVEIDGSITSNGIKTEVDEEGMKKLLECINAFLDDMLEKGNEQTRKMLKESSENFMECDGRMLCNEKDDEELFLRGDEIEIRVIRGDMDGTDFYSEEYRNVKIKEVQKNGIIITQGYLTSGSGSFIDNLESDVKIPFKEIVHVFREPNEKEMRYREKAIQNDLIKNIISEKEHEEFEKKDIDFLFKKWKHIILNRYWLYRPEHGFCKDCEYGQEREDKIDNVIKSILNGIVDKFKH